MRKAVKNLPRKWKITALVVAVVLVAWMVLSTRIITGLANRGTGFKEDQEPYTAGAYYVERGVDSIEVDKGILSSVRLQGWAYCLSPAGDDVTRTRLVLDGGTKRYVMTPGRAFRGEIQVFAGEGVAAKEMGGVNAEFSPLSMQEGTYRIAYQVLEEGQPAGTAYTDYVLVKDKGRVEARHWESTPVKMETPTYSGDVLSNLTAAYVDADGELRLEGWAGYLGQETAGQPVWLEMEFPDETTALYDTLKAADDLLTTRLQSQLYHNGVFHARLVEGSRLPIRVRAVLQSGDTVQAGRWFALTKEQDALVIDAAEETEAPQSGTADSAMQSHLRLVMQPEQGWVLAGYATLPERQSEALAQRVLLRDKAGKETTWTVRGGTSPEILITSGLSAAGNAFSLTLPLPPEEVESITLLVGPAEGGEADEWAASAPYRLEQTGEGWTAVQVSPRAEMTLPDDMPAIEEYNMDVAAVLAGGFQLEGWAVGQQPQQPYVELRDAGGKTSLYRAATLPRLDIQNLRGDEAYLYTGFAAFVPAEAPPAAYRLVLETPEGLQAAPWTELPPG